MSLARLFPVAVAATIVATAPAHAAEFRKFDRAAFDAAQAQKRPILLDVAAWWCPVCRSQDETIKQTVSAPQYAKLVIFRIDYDKQQDQWKAFGARKQGTLIAYRAASEVGRLAFVTNRDQINALLAQVVR